MNEPKEISINLNELPEYIGRREGNKRIFADNEKVAITGWAEGKLCNEISDTPIIVTLSGAVPCKHMMHVFVMCQSYAYEIRYSNSRGPVETIWEYPEVE